MYVAFWLVGGAFILVATLRDIQRQRTDTVSIFPWWAWFDVSKEKSPILFWTCISAQFLLVLACVVFAFWTPGGDN